jgi:hypothetical protein
MGRNFHLPRFQPGLFVLQIDLRRYQEVLRARMELKKPFRPFVAAGTARSLDFPPDAGIYVCYSVWDTLLAVIFLKVWEDHVIWETSYACRQVYGESVI